MTLSNDLEQTLVPVPCPRCGYEFDIEMVDVTCQVYPWCPCCRVRIQLSEGRADVSGPLQAIDSAVADLHKSIDKLNQNLGGMF